MIVYSNGCSHTAGACLAKEYTYPYAFMDYVTSPPNVRNIDEYEYHITPHRTTMEQESDIHLHKGDHLLVFHAHHGKSNDRIYYETVDTILRMIRVGKKPDYALIQWSGPNRRLFTPCPSDNRYDIGSDIKCANPHDYTEYGLYFEPYASKHTLQLMISLQDFLIKHDIEYVFIPYMELEKCPLMVEFEHLDLSKFTDDPYDGHRNNFRLKGMACDEPGHPNEIGNYYILYKILEILNLEEFDKGLSYWTSHPYSPWNVESHIKTPAGHKEGILKKYWNKLGDGTKSDIKLLDKFKNLI